MYQAGVIDKYFKLRYLFFKWRCSLTLVNKISLSLTMACFTGLLAQIYIPLPFTPVPITGQVLGVLLSGVICGGVFGAFSQIIYVGLGLVGIPWAAGGQTISFISPTSGYFLGFILASFLIGRYTDRYIWARKFFPQVWLMMFGVGIIYFCGAVVLSLVIKSGFYETMLKGVIPFIIVDLIKACISAGLSFSILPKASYNGERDKWKYTQQRY
ncbi:MAG: biotin transporter BioY [Candidatus Aminicenantes bacterium]|nr:MAG: biotin transporter BioY [Candidatus Aminicenantes bacterium]